MSTMPDQKPGKSRQNYGTPSNFLLATLGLLGASDFAWDLAADEFNTVTANGWFDEKTNSLVQDWAAKSAKRGWLWLNPPFTDIYPWARKAYEESLRGANVAMLVPLSTAEWWQDWVDNKAFVLLLAGRLTFVGETAAYPKDCALILYTRPQLTGYKLWKWKDDL